MKTQLTREYFERQGFKVIEVSDFYHGTKYWTAHYSSEYDDEAKCFTHGSFGNVYLAVSNSMYPHRFCVDGTINGEKEGFFEGRIFFTTVEDLEEFVFNICHMISDSWIPETINK